MKIKTFILTVVMAIVMIMPMTGVLAKEPYQGHVYNSYGERVAAPNAFLPAGILNGTMLGIGQFYKPGDIFVDKDNNLYILDTGNNRVVITDENYNLVKVIDKFTFNGEDSPLKEPSGIFAKNGTLYIADRLNERVVVCDMDGNISKEYRKPVTDYLEENLTFSPRKLVVNSIDTLYIISDNINEGIVEMDEDGNFESFFGAETVQLSAEDVADLFWRRFFTEEQIAQMASMSPAAYTNLMIDEHDFIYTATSLETNTVDQLKKLNPNGNNVLTSASFGDVSHEVTSNSSSDNKDANAFIDVTVDNEGFIYGLDRNSGKIFMYNQRSENLAIFGKLGSEIGCFGDVSAIESLKDDILVADQANDVITIFRPTTYGSLIKKAVNLHETGNYEEALQPWTTIKGLNNNYEMAYIGIGRAHMLMGEYPEAMYNFKLGNNKELYSVAKKANRTQNLREHFGLYILTVIVIIVLIWLAVKYREQIGEWLKKVLKIKKREKGAK